MTSKKTEDTPSLPATEAFDPRFAGIDHLPVTDALQMQLMAQAEAIKAVEAAIPDIDKAVKAATEALRNNPRGRLIYVGAGTSGRIGIQDGSELTPTFNWPTDRVAYVMAGGLKAVLKAVERAEDNTRRAEVAIIRLKVKPGDVVIGMAASGTTPFTIAALKRARILGATTIGIANSADAPLLDAAEFPVCLNTGAEAIAGSTRMKAGTAQKITLNMISTQVMIGLNHVYDGLMVDMRATNEKLMKRAARMVRHVTGCNAKEAEMALNAVQGRVKPAILVALGAGITSAHAALEHNDDNLRAAIRALNLSPPKP